MTGTDASHILVHVPDEGDEIVPLEVLDRMHAHLSPVGQILGEETSPAIIRILSDPGEGLGVLGSEEFSEGHIRLHQS